MFTIQNSQLHPPIVSQQLRVEVTIVLHVGNLLMLHDGVNDFCQGQIMPFNDEVFHS